MTQSRRIFSPFRCLQIAVLCICPCWCGKISTKKFGVICDPNIVYTANHALSHCDIIRATMVEHSNIQAESMENVNSEPRLMQENNTNGEQSNMNETGECNCDSVLGIARKARTPLAPNVAVKVTQGAEKEWSDPVIRVLAEGKRDDGRRYNVCMARGDVFYIAKMVTTAKEQATQRGEEVVPALKFLQYLQEVFGVKSGDSFLTDAECLRSSPFNAVGDAKLLLGQRFQHAYVKMNAAQARLVSIRVHRAITDM